MRVEWMLSIKRDVAGGTPPFLFACLRYEPPAVPVGDVFYTRALEFVLKRFFIAK